MSIAVETIEPSAVLETIRSAGDSGCRSCGGRSHRVGTYPTAVRRYSASSINATESRIPSGPSTRSASRSWIGMPVTCSRQAPTIFHPSFEYQNRSPGAVVGGTPRRSQSAPASVGASSSPIARPAVCCIR